MSGAHQLAYMNHRSFSAPFFQQAKLQATDVEAGDNFGRSVAIDGDTMVAGAWLESPGGISAAGAAYIFTRSNGIWTQQAKLLASDRETLDYFGFDVAISGNTVVVGAIGEDSRANFGGAAYVFTSSSTVNGIIWTQQAKLLASDGEAGDQFGSSVAIDLNTIVVGATRKQSNRGAAYIFTRSNGIWSQQATRQGSSSNNEFGRGTGVSGSTVVVGAFQQLTGGAVSVYFGSSWTLQAWLQASDAQDSDFFGRSVDIDGDTMVVGAVGEDTGGNSAGAAYIFTRSGVTWSQQAKLQASDIETLDQFGGEVSISGNTVIIGAIGEDTGGNSAGAAYIFTRSGVTWSQQAKLQASDKQDGDQFGIDVGVSGDYFVVGAHEEDTGGSNAGAAYIFKKDEL